jgi:hypothetical protein
LAPFTSSHFHLFVPFGPFSPWSCLNPLPRWSHLGPRFYFTLAPNLVEPHVLLWRKWYGILWTEVASWRGKCVLTVKRPFAGEEK